MSMHIYIISALSFPSFYVVTLQIFDLFLNCYCFIDTMLSLISQLDLPHPCVFQADHLMLNNLLGVLPWRKLILPQQLLI